MHDVDVTAIQQLIAETKRNAWLYGAYFVMRK